MKTLYLDCGMGAAGDMLTAALLELCPDPQATVAELNALGIPDVEYQMERTEKCGIEGLHMKVLVHGQEEMTHDHHDHAHSQDNEHAHHHDQEHRHDHEHAHAAGHTHSHVHRGMREITDIIAGLNLPDRVKEQAQKVYGLIAEAESHAHGKPVTQIHFHEVGTMDAIADVAAVCLLMEKLSPERVVASPVHVGSGHVHCAHGILPVPAPATAFILRGIPTYGGEISGELCTPTGAALLKHFVTEFGLMPVMKTERIGYGMGTRDFRTANCVRAMLGESTAENDLALIELKTLAAEKGMTIADIIALVKAQ